LKADTLPNYLDFTEAENKKQAEMGLRNLYVAKTEIT
jgi:hypothetical protein